MWNVHRLASPLVGLAVVGLLLGGAYASQRFWMPPLKERLLKWAGGSSASGHEDHEGHDHDHDHGHDSGNSIEVSDQGLKNIGFAPWKVALGPYSETVRWPATVVERPGQTLVHVAAPLTGIVTRVLTQEGAVVEPGKVLFEMRLTHEELVTAQRDFLKTAESLAVVKREIARLKSLSEGLVEARRVREEEYERQKLEAALLAERQGLVLHGITEPEIEAILKTGKLLQTLEVRWPSPNANEEDAKSLASHVFHVQSLKVHQGEQVEAGSPLCILADHSELYLEGRAFEDGAEQLRLALKNGSEAKAYFVTGREESPAAERLKLEYLADHVDLDSRALRFYVDLPNEDAAEPEKPGVRRFAQWKFKPGQRMEVEIPIASYEKRIVVPIGAVVDEGAESYVFRQNGKKFDRISVHVERRDRANVVIANDGKLFPGNIIAARGAYQLQLALKNKAGGGVDPHAGHSH